MSRWSIVVGATAMAVAFGALTALASADSSVVGVWQNQFGNVLVTQTAPGHYAGRMLNTFTTPVPCPGTSHVVVEGQQVWTFAPAAAGNTFTGTYNYIRKGTTAGCPGGNTQAASISAVRQGSDPYKDKLRICFANPETGAPAVYDGSSSPTNCEDESRMGNSVEATRKHAVGSYLRKITGGACVKTGPRTIHIAFRDDWTVPGAPGISDPIVKVRFYDTGHLDKGYNINSAQDFPNESTSGVFTFETNRRHGLWIKIVMTSHSGKTYTVDTRHLAHSVLPKPFPQSCVKTSNAG